MSFLVEAGPLAAPSRLSGVQPDDYPASTRTTGVLTPGGSTAGSFELAGDADWFKFHADAGQHYTFSATGVQPYMYNVYTGAGALQEAFVGVFAPSRSGDYFVAATGYQVGAYNLSLNQLADDYSGNDSHPGELTDGGQATGTLEFVLDVDRFKMTMKAGYIYTVSYGDNAGASPLTMQCFGPGGAAASVSSVHGADGLDRLVIMPTTTGLYSLDVGSYFTFASGISYTLTAQGVERDDYAATRAEAAPLDIGGQLDGSIQAAQDTDMFRVELTAGTTYAFSLLPATTQPYNVMQLGLSDSAGKSIAVVAPGQEKLYSYTPSVSGSYYLSASVQYGNGLPYTIAASLAVDDVGASAASAGALLVGQSVRGELEAGGGDRDWYAVSLDAGATYRFSLHGQHDGQGTLPSNFYGQLLRVVDAKGATLGTTAGQDLQFSDSPVLSFLAPAKGTYYVEVSSRDRAVGTYQLQAQLGVRDDFGNDAAHAAPLAIGVLTPGVLEVQSDRDSFKFSAAAGATYAFKLSPTASGYLASFGLNLTATDSAGNYFSLRNFSGQGNDSLYVFEPQASGDYTLTVANQFTTADGRGYRLTALAYGADDYAASDKTTAVLPVNGQWQARLDSPGDGDWAKVRLEAGRSYVFELAGALSGAGSLDIKGGGVHLSLADNYGNYVRTNVLDASEVRQSYVATRSGDYYVQVGTGGEHAGSYTVSVADTTGDTTAPYVVAAMPADGAGGVRPTTAIDIVFSESVMLGATAGMTLKDSNGKAVDLLTNGKVATVAGHHLLLHPANLMPGMSYTLQLGADSVLDLAGNRLAAPLSHTFSTVAASVSGGDGNDYLVGTLGGQIIDGGAGIDTISYSQGFLQIKHSGAGYTVTSWGGGASVSDTLTGIERVLMPLQAVALDIDGHGGQAYRLYQAAFNRTPDQAGLGFWMSAMDKGTDLRSVARDFVASPEFINAYGANPSDADFVNLLYHNVLHRDGDASGVAFWLHALQGGTPRENVLADFSESAENQAALIGTIGNGFTYTPYG
jgi:hypothetical protein